MLSNLLDPHCRSHYHTDMFSAKTEAEVQEKRYLLLHGPCEYGTSNAQWTSAVSVIVHKLRISQQHHVYSTKILSVSYKYCKAGNFSQLKILPLTNNALH